MKSLFKMVAIFLIVTMFLVACGGGEADEPAAEEPAAEEAAVEEEVAEEPAAEEEAAEEEMAEEEMEEMAEVIEIQFWHAMGGELGETVDELAARFNASHDHVQVVTTFQGSYDDTYNALLASFDTGTEPNITQNFDLAAQTMFDTGRLVAANSFDGFDGDIFVPAVRDYYSDDSGMVGMAFNSSTPIMYYNADMFTELGIDPPALDSTFSDIIATCDELQAAGVEFCITFGQVGWFFEQILANSGGLYFNNDNGRTGRADEAVFNEGQGVEVFTFLSGLIADGYAPNLGKTWTDTDTTFQAGQAAMIFDSTSGALSMQEGADFTVSTTYIPHSDSSDRNGVVIGGAALWLIDSGDDAVNQAAWEVMQFMAQPEQQVTWHSSTGYFPVRTDLDDNADLLVFWEENPNFRTAIDQLASTNTTMADGSPNYAVLGGKAGPFPAIRQFIVDAYSLVLDDGMSAQDALNVAAEKANQELSDYNAFFE